MGPTCSLVHCQRRGAWYDMSCCASAPLRREDIMSAMRWRWRYAGSGAVWGGMSVPELDGVGWGGWGLGHLVM